MGPILLLNLIVSLVADSYSMHVSMNSINQQMVSGHWDMLRLTTVDESEIIQAKYVIAQIRAWRVLGLEMGLRTLCGLALLFSIVGFIPRSLRGLRSEGSLDLVLILVVEALLLTLVFVLEPTWRMRAMTAMGLSISAQGRDSAFSALSAFGTVIFARIAQFIILAGLFYGVNETLWFVYRSSRVSDPILLSVLLTAGGILLAGLVMFVYWRLTQNAALRRALRLAFRGTPG